MELTNVKVGLKNTVTDRVTDENTAAHLGSGTLPVYGTPALSCLMEQAAAELVEPLLPDGWTTVGGSMELMHEAPTPVGMSVRAEAEVTAVEGRKIVFAVRAYDEAGEIGKGTHVRFAVAVDRFMAKAAGRNAAGNE